MADIAWNECQSYARYQVAGDEQVVVCELPLHCDPMDDTAWHWDSRFDIYWRYADGGFPS